MNPREFAPTLAMVLLAMFATAFAFMNYGNKVNVWPFPGVQSLTLVIGISFALGSLVIGLIAGRSIRKRDVGAVRAERASAPTEHTERGDAAARR